jgi:predicted GNAT family acetyltransferase
MTVTVIDNKDMNRYELLEDGVVAAFEDYELRGDRIAFVHTEALEGHEGKGYARTLVDEVLADARRRGLGVLPRCPYVAKVIARNPEAYLDLVPLDARAEFELPG